ncbi:TPM domain-containing protein [Priestia aryabhattai]|uniref:TPM domain-containing protein n=1 Tax=Priestia aryabhattai TaxID=412384 RepID=A0AAX6NDG5_PRIAR|nr:TPM domain-containing protein [Priestia aryabhattai]MDU9693700.1 TPM domain-containing protein [Priestia aryabhattai]
MKLLAPFVFIIALLFNTSSVAFAASDIPKPVGDIYVQDFANILNEEEKSEIIDMAEKLDDETEAQIGILTVNSLNDSDIENFSNEAFREYGLGSKELNNGILIILALKEKQVRVEVGYGLEGRVTDIKSGEILDNYAIPYLKDKKYDKAIMNTYKAVYNEAAKEYELGKDFQQKVSKAPHSSKEESGLKAWQVILIVIAVIILIILDFIFFKGAITEAVLYMLLSARGGGGDGPRGGGGGSSGGGGASRGW